MPRVPQRLLYKIDTENENERTNYHDSYVRETSIKQLPEGSCKGRTNVCDRPSADNQKQKRGDGKHKSSNAIPSPHTIKSMRLAISIRKVRQGVR